MTRKLIGQFTRLSLVFATALAAAPLHAGDSRSSLMSAARQGKCGDAMNLMALAQSEIPNDWACVNGQSDCRAELIAAVASCFGTNAARIAARGENARFGFIQAAKFFGLAAEEADDPGLRAGYAAEARRNAARASGSPTS